MPKQSQPARVRHRERGSSFIETAILLPMLLMVCCGTMDFARVMYAAIEVSNAARAGVQYGALTPGHALDTAGMKQAVLSDAADLGASNVTATASNYCACDGATVPCSDTGCASTPDGYVTVTASYTFNSVVHYPGLPQTFQLKRTARMRVQ